jgi:hypothetical protein
MRDLVIIGERPGPNTDPLVPLFPHTTTGAAARLIQMLGIPVATYLRKVIRYNVVDNHDDGILSGRKRLLERMDFHRRRSSNVRFVFLGRETIRGAGPPYSKIPFGTVHGDVMLIPHPSGRNRYYNSLANRTFITQALREFAGILEK